MIAVNGVRAIGVRILMPCRGVWVADVQLDPEVLAQAPSSGPAVITIGTSTKLVGTVDPRGTGAFSNLYSLRVLGGGAGWDQPVSAQHYHNDAGLSSVDVYAMTATAAGEKVQVLAPKALGPDFVRSAGPASRVLEAEPSWWVDPSTGVTMVGPRPPATPDASMALTFFDPTLSEAKLTCDALVLPGTPIIDERLPGVPPVIRDVEQVFDAKGSTVRAWVGKSPVAQLAGDLRSMVLEFAGVKTLRTYLYRIVQQGPDGRLQLQVVHRNSGAPDTLPIAPWTGLSGASAKYRPGTTVRVAFIEGDKTQPIADSYEPGVIPLEATIDAAGEYNVGPSSLMVAIAGGGDALVSATPFLALVALLEAFASALAGSPLAPIGAAGQALATGIAAIPLWTTTRTKAT